MRRNGIVLMGLFDLLRKRTRHKAVFCGLDNSGKTTFISFLKEGRFIQHYPTLGKNKQEIIIEGTRIIMFDMGGQSQFRKMWLGELDDARCIVYVIDKSNKARYDESKKEFAKLLPLIKRKHLKLLFVSNKFDLDTESNIEEIINTFDLTKLDSFDIIETSAKTGYGMADAFVKFYTLLTGQYTEKILVTKSIGVYTLGGKEIVTHNHDDINLKDEFIKEEIPKMVDNFSKSNSKTVKIKIENEYVLIMKKGREIICSFLWHPNLNSTIITSEETLKDLLEHIETMPNIVNSQDIIFQLLQYSTNLV